MKKKSIFQGNNIEFFKCTFQNGKWVSLIGIENNSDGDVFLHRTICAHDHIPNCRSVSTNIVRKWSRARDPLNTHFRPFAHEPTIQLSQWTLVWSWKNYFSPFIKQDKASPEFWYVKPHDGIPIESTEVIKRYDYQMSE